MILLADEFSLMMISKREVHGNSSSGGPDHYNSVSTFIHASNKTSKDWSKSKALGSKDNFVVQVNIPT